MSQIPLIIPIENFDVEEALESWHWLYPKEYTPLFLTAFGDWILGSPDGSIHLLDIIEGQVTKIAENNIEFNRLKETTKKKDEWFLESLVLGLVNQNILLKPGECYGFEIPPILGGKIEIGNVRPFLIAVYEAITGQIHEQIRKKR